MNKASLHKLNPVQLSDLREMIATGKMPRLITIGVFVQHGFMEPGTFTLSPGVKEAVIEFVRERRAAVNVLNHGEILRALQARKDPPIL